MAVFPPWFGLKATLRDTRNFLKRRSREQTIGAILAGLVTTIIVLLFFIDSNFRTAPPPQITYIESFDGNRSDEEIIAQQMEEQRAIDEANRARQQGFQDLSNRLGIE